MTILDSRLNAARQYLSSCFLSLFNLSMCSAAFLSHRDQRNYLSLKSAFNRMYKSLAELNAYMEVLLVDHPSIDYQQSEFNYANNGSQHGEFETIDNEHY